MTTNPNRLLIIDDEPEICSFVGDVADAMGFDVAVANQPEEFWDAYYAFAPTGIVLDLQTPEADGAPTNPTESRNIPATPTLTLP